MSKVHRRFKVGIILTTLVVIVVMGESVLRSRGTFLTWSERSFGKYASGYGIVHDTYLHLRTPSITDSYHTVEYDYPVISNREGIRDRDHDEKKPEGVFRILLLGDSYVESAGALTDQTWPRQLEQRLTARGLRVEVISGGVAGSDPFYAWKLLERLQVYEPDLVIQAVNGSDVDDVLIRGGLERFRDDGRTHFKKGPWFEPLYRVSHLVRFLVDPFYDMAFILRLRRQEVYAAGLELIRSGLALFQQKAEEDEFEFAVVLHPTPVDLRWNNHYPFGPEYFESLKQVLPNAFDLFAKMAGLIDEGNLETYAWPIDAHFKAEGYGLMAELLEQQLLDAGLLPLPGDARP